MSDENLPQVVLFVGNEASLIADAVQKLRSAALPGSAAAFNASVYRVSDGADGAVAQARTLPMMAKRRFVEVRGLDGANVALLEALTEYAQRPSPSTVMAITGSKLPNNKAGKALKKAVEQVGLYQRFRSGDQRPESVAEARAREAGCRLESRAARRLVELTGTDSGRLRMEVDKLVCAVGGEGAITVRDVESSCALVAEAVVWELTDALVARDAGRAADACHRLLEAAGAQRSSHQLISMLAWQVRDLLSLQAALRAKEPPPKKWSRNRRKLQQATDTLRRRPIDPARITAALARANRQLNRSRAGDQRVFEGLVLELTSG